jgi:hypothetical protein
MKVVVQWRAAFLEDLGLDCVVLYYLDLKKQVCTASLCDAMEASRRGRNFRQCNADRRVQNAKRCWLESVRHMPLLKKYGEGSAMCRLFL